MGLTLGFLNRSVKEGAKESSTKSVIEYQPHGSFETYAEEGPRPCGRA